VVVPEERQTHQAHTGEQQEQAHQAYTDEQHHTRQQRRRQPKKKQPPPHELLRLPETYQEAFAVLYLPLTASTQEIKQAYRRQALQAHPDHGGSHAAMVILNRAYELALEKGAGQPWAS
jgi:DnaJ-domain-containing protein 1